MLSDFFEPAPEPDVVEPTRYRLPPWVGAPSGTLPGVVALERILAQTEKVAVCVTAVAAYPTGFEFDLITMGTEGHDGSDPWLFESPRRMRGGASEDIPPERLRFGIQFSDGSKATNIGARFHGSEPPTAPIMQAGGGGGGGGNWHQTQWVWPLPPPGTLTLVCEWPAMGIPLTRSEFDAQLIIDAATRAQVIFSDEHLPEPPDEGEGWSPAPFGY